MKDKTIKKKTNKEKIQTRIIINNLKTRIYKE